MKQKQPIKGVDKKELLICRKRGHNWFSGHKWAQCRFCRMWLREVCTIEERETEPPEEEVSSLHRIANPSKTEKATEEALKKALEKATGRKR
jgi:hypothetical protein